MLTVTVKKGNYVKAVLHYGKGPAEACIALARMQFGDKCKYYAA